LEIRRPAVIPGDVAQRRRPGTHRNTGAIWEMDPGSRFARPGWQFWASPAAAALRAGGVI